MSEMVLEVVVHTEIVLKQDKSIRELARSEQSTKHILESLFATVIERSPETELGFGASYNSNFDLIIADSELTEMQ